MAEWQAWVLVYCAQQRPQTWCGGHRALFQESLATRFQHLSAAQRWHI